MSSSWSSCHMLVIHLELLACFAGAPFYVAITPLSKDLWRTFLFHSIRFYLALLATAPDAFSFTL